MMSHQISLQETVQQTGVLRCLECGKCTAVCPISHYDHAFSPRRTVGRALMRRDSALLTDDRLWACLTCLHCSQVCPAAVSYADLTFGVRATAYSLGHAAVCTHGETIHAWMRMMMDPSLKQNRLGWLCKERKALAGAARDQGEALGKPPMSNMMDDTLAVSDESDTLFFVGCAPYFSVQFGQIGVDGNQVSRATVQLLNTLGIKPQVLADERCCGHDLLWEGDVEGFETLAQLNTELIRQSGAARIVTSCPECARALKVDYAAHGFDLGVDVLYLTELLAQEGWTGTRFTPLRVAHSTKDDGAHQSARRVTFQDPCRLGRHLGIYDAPRQAIQALGFELIEMPRHKENALCCGTNGWTHCGAANRQIQGDRLSEAQATGANVLVTACLKCQIHLKCALQDRHMGTLVTIEIKDLATLMAESLR